MTRTTRKPPPPDELRAFFAEHVLYEIEMLFSLANRLAFDINLDRIMQNATIEAFALHTRVLLDFLYRESPPPSRPNDALARDYAPTWSPGNQGRILEGINDRVGAQVVHLTYGRMMVTYDIDEKTWPFADIYHELGDVVHRFLDRIPETSIERDLVERARHFLPDRQKRLPGLLLRLTGLGPRARVATSASP